MKQPRGSTGLERTFPIDLCQLYHGQYQNDRQKLFAVSEPSDFGLSSKELALQNLLYEDWINKVLAACKEYGADCHKYLFLTKNPARYQDFCGQFTRNMWLGATVTNVESAVTTTLEMRNLAAKNKYLSLEPLHEDIAEYVDFSAVKWVIVGAETGKRHGKILPKKEWLEKLADKAILSGTPIFMKNNLSYIWREPLIQQVPSALTTMTVTKKKAKKPKFTGGLYGDRYTQQTIF